MCMKRLYQTIEEAIINKKWKPIYASRNGTMLSNLFFADDIVLFAESSEEQPILSMIVSLSSVMHQAKKSVCRSPGCTFLTM